MACHTTDLDGVTHLNPSRSDYAALLRAFMADAGSAGDIWMTHLETGWSLSVYPSGLVRLRREGLSGIVREAGPMPCEAVLALWDALAAGEIDRLLGRSWREVDRDDDF